MASERPKKKLGKKILTGAGIILGVIVLAVGWLLGWLTLSEFRPEPVETLAVEGAPSAVLTPGRELTVMTWNVGYGALGDNADFFMDGGTGVRTADETRVRENLAAVTDVLRERMPDVVFLQEVDRDSDRSHHIDEAAEITAAMPGYANTFAYNYRVLFVPYPVPPIGKVNSGLLTLSGYPVSASRRIQLPCPFSWPMRLGNLKRCLMVDRVPLENSDRELVLVNLHLEAYDDGEGKIAQTEMLRQLLETEAAAGNYVIAGGDFNQIFSTVENPWPAQEGMWRPGEIDVSAFQAGWQFAMDGTTPSCRSLDKPYAGADRETFQYYLIDGFLLSEGLSVESLETLDLGFAASDHNPVLLAVRLPQEG